MNIWLYFLVFLKANLLSTGGPSALPILQQDLVSNGLASNNQFVEALAIGQISPGPNGLWMVCLGYMNFGWLGAITTLIAVCLPPFLVIIIDFSYGLLQKRPQVKGFIRGSGLAVTGLTVVVSFSLLNSFGSNWINWLTAFSALSLAYTRRFNVITILFISGIIGCIFYYF